MSPEELAQLRGLRGLVATCVTSGVVDPDFALAREDLRAWNIEHEFRAVEYRTFNCTLVEAGRDSVAAHMLHERYDWVLQIDADAAPFAPDSLARLLHAAYLEVPDADAIGAYAQLKQPPYLPTIDTGTGTWEVHYPGEGILPVIRTGGHFLLAKRSAYEKVLANGAPSIHRTRAVPSALDVLLEMDNMAHCAFHGSNPFASMPEWEHLVERARGAAPSGPSHVGEDSGFCDNLLAAGGALYVHTDVVAGHMARVSVTPEMMRQQLELREQARRRACGMLA